jgi:hypothetical protein
MRKTETEGAECETHVKTRFYEEGICYLLATWELAQTTLSLMTIVVRNHGGQKM